MKLDFPEKQLEGVTVADLKSTIHEKSPRVCHSHLNFPL